MLRKPIIINRGSGEVLIVACGAAYHTPRAVDQNILRRAQNGSGHSHGKADVESDWQILVKSEENPARGDVSSQTSDLIFAS